MSRLHRLAVLHFFGAVAILTTWSSAADIEKVSEHCWVQLGSINGAVIRANDQQLAVYGWDQGPVDRLLLTHGRRDVVWRGAAAMKTAQVVAPAREEYMLEKGPDYWAGFPKTQAHDYAQQTTKVPQNVIPVGHWVSNGDRLTWNGLTIDVLETPGYTRGSVTYVVEVDGKRVGFCGDLLYGEGQLLDLFSFQDAITDAQVRGYHGYGARLAELVTSLDKIIESKVDIVVPARGPIIYRPAESARRLKGRVQDVYRNYLSSSALHWYFKEERMRHCGERVLGKGADIELMRYVTHEKTPEWIYENSTSRLLISESGRGFLMDCGYQRVIDAVQELIDQEVIERVDGIFVTHYHDDHTDMIQAAANKFQCPVYATPEYADVLERPDAYHLPALTGVPIQPVQRMKNGQSMKWNEFQLTFYHFPGQTLYHGALFVEKPNERPVLFVGDSFAPSGIDDYCVLNRNLLHDDQGYLSCFQRIRDLGRCWLINQHINYVFSFSEEELKCLESRYRARRDMLTELFPWDDPNYGIDEQWAVLYPRTMKAHIGDRVELELRITNHSPVEREFRFTPRLPPGLSLESRDDALKLQPNASGTAKLSLRIENDGGTSRVVTADIHSDEMNFPRWVDALIRVER